MMEPKEIANGCKYGKTCTKADVRCRSDIIQKSCPGYTMFEIDSLQAENERLQAELEKQTALAQIGQSAIDTNLRLARELTDTQRREMRR